MTSSEGLDGVRKGGDREREGRVHRPAGKKKKKERTLFIRSNTSQLNDLQGNLFSVKCIGVESLRTCRGHSDEDRVRVGVK